MRLALLLTIILASALLLASCTAMVPTPEPVTSAERVQLSEGLEAQNLANIEKYKAEVEKLRLQLSHDPAYIQAQSQARLSESQADMMSRITEAREQMTADYQQMVQTRDAFAFAMNDHMATFKNTELFLQGYAERTETLDHNALAAADNSWVAAWVLGFFGVLLLGLTATLIVFCAKFERRLAALE